MRAPVTTRGRVTVALWGLVAVALVAVVAWKLVATNVQADVAGTLGRGDYRLTTTDGQPFTESSLKGQPSAVFFGFTHCPDVCPTTLGDIAGWQETLAKDGEQLRVFFVTVDPERDTAALLKDYVGWVPGVTGVTGTPEEVAKAVRAFRIYARKVPLEGGGYTMDHSATVLLFDRDGRLFEPIGYQEDTARVNDKLKRLFAI